MRRLPCCCGDWRRGQGGMEEGQQHGGKWLQTLWGSQTQPPPSLNPNPLCFKADFEGKMGRGGEPPRRTSHWGCRRGDRGSQRDSGIPAGAPNAFCVSGDRPVRPPHDHPLPSAVLRGERPADKVRADKAITARGGGSWRTGLRPGGAKTLQKKPTDFYESNPK